MKKVLITFVLLLLLASLAGGSYYLYQKTQESPVVFVTESPFTATIIKKTVASGSITPRKEVEIKSQVSGVVEKLLVEPGQRIAKGAELARIRVIPNTARLNQAESDLKAAQINFENASREFDRQKELRDLNIISDQEYKRLETTYQLRKEALSGAQSNLEIVREGAARNTSESNNIVRSTLDGMVLDVPVREGSFVTETNTFNAGTTIASIADMREMIFEGQVDESEVGKLHEGMPLVLRIGAIQNEKFDAKLEYISPKGVERSGAIQFTIKAAVVLRDEFFVRAGYSANADIVLDRADDVLAIREGNLIIEKGKYFVEIETAPKAFEKREIQVALSDGINIQVVSGLTLQDKIKKR